MSKRFLLLTVPLMFFLPTILHAMMGGFVDEVELHTKDVGIVIYSHSKHGTDCGACHPKLFNRKQVANHKRGKGPNHATMKQMEKGKSCGACHNGKKAFSVKANCAKCHSDAIDIVFKDEDAGNVTFPHSAHLEMYSCDECHPDLFQARRGANKATMEEMESGASCGACHDGDTAFNVAEDCESCHQE